MMNVPLWAYILLCIFALMGVAGFLWFVETCIIEPLIYFFRNYGRYKRFYDEYYGEYLKSKFKEKTDGQEDENDE